MPKMLRITLDIPVSPLGAEAIAASGAEQLPEDCRPSGTDEDLNDTSPRELAELVADALAHDEEMFAGSGIYATFAPAKVVSAEWVS